VCLTVSYTIIVRVSALQALKCTNFSMLCEKGAEMGQSELQLDYRVNNQSIMALNPNQAPIQWVLSTGAGLPGHDVVHRSHLVPILYH
jgi:hypothetical protein